MKRKQYSGRADCLRPAAGGGQDYSGRDLLQAGVSEPTFTWLKKQFAGMGTVEIRRLKQFEKKNAKLKRLVAGLSLNKTMLQSVL